MGSAYQAITNGPVQEGVPKTANYVYFQQWSVCMYYWLLCFMLVCKKLGDRGSDTFCPQDLEILEPSLDIILHC